MFLKTFIEHETYPNIFFKVNLMCSLIIADQKEKTFQEIEKIYKMTLLSSGRYVFKCCTIDPPKKIK